MEERSYRLAQYEIIEKSNGEIWWKAHGGFADAKNGKCFIEGEILFIGPSEMHEAGFLKNEFLEHLRQFPQWDRTKYYCPSYTLYTCKGGRARDVRERPPKKEPCGHNRRDNSSMFSTDETAHICISPLTHIRQVRGKLGEAFRRCKGLIGLSSEKNDLEE